jgi:autotransporter passenger strand-loop-strand repeat protein
VPNTEIVTPPGKTVSFTSADTIYLVQPGARFNLNAGGIAGLHANGAQVYTTLGTVGELVLEANSQLLARVQSQFTNMKVLSGSKIDVDSAVINGLVIQDSTALITRSTVSDFELDNAYVEFWGTSVDGLTLVNGATMLAANSVTLKNIVISSGGSLQASVRASVEGTTINDGGYENLSWESTAQNTVIGAGGAQEIIGGSTASFTTVQAGGYQGVGGTDLRGTSPSRSVNTTLSGNQQVVAGGQADTTLILSGGSQYIGAGSLATNTVINAGGLQFVGMGGTANNTEINSGGFAFVQGTATATTINDGGSQQITGTASGATVASGGALNILAGGHAAATKVATGGYMDVTNGAIDGTTLAGNLQVRTGGVATNTAIVNGGSAYIGSGGSTNNSVINAGGLEFVDAGGKATGTTVSGGYQFVNGTTNGTEVDGGWIDVGASGVANDTLLSTGFMYVSAGGAAHNVDFAGTSEFATIYLDDPASLNGTISNFAVGDTIDFVNTSFASYQMGLSTLTLVTDGGASYTYQFSGTQAGTDLTLANDGHGGTSLSLLSQFSANLVPEAGQHDSVISRQSMASEPTLVHAQT